MQGNRPEQSNPRCKQPFLRVVYLGGDFLFVLIYLMQIADFNKGSHDGPMTLLKTNYHSKCYSPNTIYRNQWNRTIVAM